MHLGVGWMSVGDHQQKPTVFLLFLTKDPTSGIFKLNFESISDGNTGLGGPFRDDSYPMLLLWIKSDKHLWVLQHSCFYGVLWVMVCKELKGASTKTHSISIVFNERSLIWHF